MKDVLTKHGARSEKAVRAMLDLDALKISKNRREDIDKAMAELKKSDAYLFGAEPTGLKRVVGVNIVPPPALGGSPAQPDETGGFPPACPASAKDKTGPSPGRFRFQSAALIDGRPAFRGTPKKGFPAATSPAKPPPNGKPLRGAFQPDLLRLYSPPGRRSRSAVFAPHTAATPSSNGGKRRRRGLPDGTCPVSRRAPSIPMARHAKRSAAIRAALRFLSRLCRQSAKRLCDARRAAGVVQRKLHV